MSKEISIFLPVDIITLTNIKVERCSKRCYHLLTSIPRLQVRKVSLVQLVTLYLKRMESRCTLMALLVITASRQILTTQTPSSTSKCVYEKKELRITPLVTFFGYRVSMRVKFDSSQATSYDR